MGCLSLLSTTKVPINTVIKFDIMLERVPLILYKNPISAGNLAPISNPLTHEVGVTYDVLVSISLTLRRQEFQELF